MAKKYAEPVGWILLDGLKKGRSLLQLLWGTTKFHGPSRLAVYMDVITYRPPRKARPTLATLARELNADIPEVRKWQNVLIKEGWFAKDKDDGFWRPLYKGRQKLRGWLQADVAVRWVISDLTEKSEEVDGKIRSVCRDEPAPHGNHGNQFGNVGFMEEVGRSEPTIIRCLDSAAADGFTIRFPRPGKGRKTLYVRPDNQDAIWNLQQQYGRYYDQAALPAEGFALPAMVQSMVTIEVAATAPPQAPVAATLTLDDRRRAQEELERRKQVAWEHGIDLDGLPLAPIKPMSGPRVKRHRLKIGSNG